MRILLSGGGTGGHVYPILSVIEALRGDHPAAEPLPSRLKSGPAGSPAQPVELLYVGEAGGVEQGLAERAGIPFRSVATGQIRGRAPWTVARNLARMARGAAQCAALLREFRPHVVLLTGGYVAAPVAWAAWRARIPVLIYLPDITPGLAIRLTSRLATRVAVSFPEVARWFPGKAVVTGYPVRPALLTTERAAARAALRLEDDLPALLVFGGSRGARSINRALALALPQLLPICQVLHISGTLDWPAVAEQQAALAATPYGGRYRPYAYLNEEMTAALAAADLAVARAGASTLGEFPAVGLPSILAPYPYAGQHQEANAAYLADRGAAVIVHDRDLDAGFASSVLELLNDAQRLAKMASAARAMARPDAATHIARELHSLAAASEMV